MSLKIQLALVALISLLLPWAGLNYVRETELALRANQQSLLTSVAAGIASTLSASNPIDLPRSSAETLYLVRLARVPVLDGYRSDWGTSLAPLSARQGDQRMRYLGAEFQGKTYLYVETPPNSAELVLSTGPLIGDAADYRIDLRLPGAQSPAGNVSAAPINAYVEVTGRTRVELSLDTRDVAARLGLTLLDAGGEVVARSFESPEPPPPVAPVATLERELQRYRQPGTALHVTNADGWIIASAAGSVVDISSDRETIASLLFRRLLDRTGEAVTEYAITDGRDRNDWVVEALSGNPASRWVKPIDERATASMIVAVPIRGITQEIQGALVLRRDASARLLSSSESLARLALLTLAATVGTAVVLLAYALWLSLRVRRLARAADSALAPDGDLRTGLPEERSGDEIGSLSRSFARLLERVREYNHYLKTLSSRLSHELNTPLSVVSSSLENLSAESLTSEQARYTDRAQQGIDRMRTLVRTMSEATRVEQAAGAATRERFDLVALLQQLTAAYQDSFAPVDFTLTLDADKATVFGAPALIVQAIDKVADNAVSFAAEQSPVRLSLALNDDEAVITIDNDGPLLSRRECAQVFESLVSLRDEGGHAHLGFGLYVARLIVEAHEGRISAEPLASRNGMRFLIHLPLDRRSTVDVNQPAAC